MADPLQLQTQEFTKANQGVFTTADRTLRGDRTQSDPPKWYKDSLKLRTLKIQQMQEKSLFRVSLI